LPEGWCWASPEQLAAPEPYALAIGPFGSNLLVSDYQSDGVPLVFVRHVRAGVFSGLEDKFVSPEKARELSPHRVDPGDVVITKMGEPPGDAAVYPESSAPGVITADVLKWRISPAAGAPRYFAFATRSAVVHAQIVALTQGVSQKKISLQRFRTVAYPLPPAAEQHRISAEIERRMSLLQGTSAAVHANRDRLSRLRRSILRWAFEGRLADQDPNDEPASVLLERIRAEHAAAQRSDVVAPRTRRVAKRG
jgi:type I restriction enzyme S subunit